MTMSPTMATTMTINPLMVTLNASGGEKVAGESYALTCTVTGGSTMTFTYRWFMNNSPLSGETSTTLTFSPLRQNNSGTYFCEAETTSSMTMRSASTTITVEGRGNFNGALLHNS